MRHSLRHRPDRRPARTAGGTGRPPSTLLPYPERLVAVPLNTGSGGRLHDGFVRALGIALGTLVVGVASLSAQPACPPEVNARLDSAWAAYRAQRYDAADTLFASMVAACPGHVDARVGIAYVRLQQNQLDTAVALFDHLIAEVPDHIDALVGAGLARWRRGDAETAIRHFRRVLELEPDHALAREYVNRMREIGQLYPRPPTEAALSTSPPSRSARTHERHFDVLQDGQWEPIYLKGVNLGAALPGRHPSEFPDSTTYAQWIEQMGEIGFNLIRVYTIHPPGFYQALHDYNARHPDQPIRVLHGVWAELPPGGQYDDPAWQSAFSQEMHNVVDVIHGRVDIGLAPDLTVPYYTADISPWVLGYSIGREWEPSSLQEYQRAHPDRSTWQGEYFTVENQSAVEVFLAQAMNEMVRYEMEKYGRQRPIAFTSWPTLDPLWHVSEASRAAQNAYRLWFGDAVGIPARKAEEDDEIQVDASAIRPTAQMAAGTFAVFHAYPYYPDFLINDPALQSDGTPEARSNYSVYLRRLAEAVPDLPIVIAEYGVPAGVAAAHLQPQGWHHGGHSEQEMARIDGQLTREIAAAGLAGGAIFAWIDEWFKKNWLVVDVEVPAERNRLWWNSLDPEQHYGMYALEPEPRLGDGPLTDRLEAWRSVEPIYVDRWGTVRAYADEAYLHLLFENADRSPPDTVYFGLDMVDADGGDHRWPGRIGPRLPVGLEFVVAVTKDQVRILADQGADHLEVIEVGPENAPTDSLVIHRIRANRPPGLFVGRLFQRYPKQVESPPNDDGVYNPLRVVTNDARIGRDSLEYAGMGYERGVLPAGPLPDGLWETAPSQGALEVRIPWTLINVTDPSQRRVLHGPVIDGTTFTTTTVDDIGIAVAAWTGNRWRTWPHARKADQVARFTWEPWEADDIQWRSRRRPVADTLRALFPRLHGSESGGDHSR